MTGTRSGAWSSRPFADNARAIRLYRRFGFEVEGTLRGCASTAGCYVDALSMARVRPV